ncbi:hypothetical protein [Aliarcobacter skirrowii]|uniref:hypothetical protein n=1 Tax=Aliarcobacter skirrowii TaxID=28200 RepID=UPI0021B4C13E|nr:hypothetical protein [Aliarcobacter skirrowii]MCT7446740.1 hypothetical protein [Aliarcobacter skirrowii]MDX4036819.1 hypothetical protein [Aliarcobacter skirrowii]MDX4050888.1 hypothetical protein [Aliarcobacter skirrowii]MDX4063809.1 hypothetical protein [Aliarcobacter skirrowii]MDX4065388.1 hypothetical protein [Aliarcobacter skirrowii]
MKTIKLQIADNVFEKVFYFLNNLPKDEVMIVENSEVEDWSFLEKEIQKGLDSGISNKSHEDIIKNLKQKYA